MRRFPHHMTLELTAKCNFRCPYCYCVWHERPELAKPELDAAGWKRIIDKCAADGVDEILFTGGKILESKHSRGFVHQSGIIAEIPQKKIF